MTQLADYLDLRTEVVRLLKTTAVVEDFANYTKAAERWISRNLRHRKQIRETSIALANNRAPLPADCLEIIEVCGPQGGAYVQVPITSVESVCGAPQELQTGDGGLLVDTGGGYLLANEPTIRRGADRFYAINDGDIIIGGNAGVIDVRYYALIPTITGSLTHSNWCLSDHPELYIYATMACAAPGRVSPDALPLIEAKRDRYLEAARLDTHRAQYGAAAVRVGGFVE